MKHIIASYLIIAGILLFIGNMLGSWYIVELLWPTFTALLGFILLLEVMYSPATERKTLLFFGAGLLVYSLLLLGSRFVNDVTEHFGLIALFVSVASGAYTVALNNKNTRSWRKLGSLTLGAALLLVLMDYQKTNIALAILFIGLGLLVIARPSQTQKES